MSEKVRILGVPVLRSDVDRALEEVETVVESGGSSLIAYVNAHTLNLAWRDEAYRRILNDAALVLNDGIGIELAARMRKRPFPANLNGSDLNPKILELSARRGWKVFLLGASDGVARRVGETFTARLPELQVVGAHHGYFADDDEIVRTIKEAGADVLMVAMGNPLQEKWLARHLPATGARLGVGVGAFFDFTTGTQRRAPAWMNRLGIEWVWRLARDPKRMWRRYVVGNPLFLWRAWRTRRREATLDGVGSAEVNKNQSG